MIDLSKKAFFPLVAFTIIFALATVFIEKIVIFQLWEMFREEAGILEIKHSEEKTDGVEVQIIETKKGDEFSVVLETNPTTGYQWEIDFDSDYIQLVDREYLPTAPELIGSGGQETFNFLALKSGETEMIFSYLRIWENEPPIEEKIYNIIIE